MRKIRIILGLIALYSSLAIAQSDQFTVTSSAKTKDGILPPAYSCSGKNISPDIAWSGAPQKTQAFALIVKDPDAPGGTFYHWVLYNIPKETQAFALNQTEFPEGTIVGYNNFGKLQYSGPCPPIGPSHRYFFTVYALDSRLNLAIGRDAKAIENEANKHTLAKAEFIANYRHY